MRAALNSADGDAPAKDFFNTVDEELYKQCFPQMFPDAEATGDASNAGETMAKKNGEETKSKVAGI